MDDPFGLLFDSYFAARYHVFVRYIKDKQDEYFVNQANMQNLSHVGLVAIKMFKYNYLSKRKKTVSTV